MAGKSAKRRELRWRLFLKSPDCVYCKRRLRWEQTTLDHLVPQSVGGGDDEGNLVLSCKPCNMAKRNRTLGDWIEDLERLRKRIYIKQRPGQGAA